MIEINQDLVLLAIGCSVAFGASAGSVVFWLEERKKRILEVKRIMDDFLSD